MASPLTAAGGGRVWRLPPITAAVVLSCWAGCDLGPTGRRSEAAPDGATAEGGTTIRLVGSAVEIAPSPQCRIDPSYFYLSTQERHREEVVNRFPYRLTGALFVNARLLQCGGQIVQFVWTHESTGVQHRWRHHLPPGSDRYPLASVKQLRRPGDWQVSLQHDGRRLGGLAFLAETPP